MRDTRAGVTTELAAADRAARAAGRKLSRALSAVRLADAGATVCLHRAEEMLRRARELSARTGRAKGA